MKPTRRHMSLMGAGVLAMAASGTISVARAAESADEAGLEKSVEAFRKAMLANDKSQFEMLCADQLSYGHSSGKLQDKAEFIADATSGKSHWKSLTFSKQTHKVAGDDGIARFILTGETESEGKLNPVNIGVLMVWQKQNNQWKLLARQAYKI
jgi:Domain of unknown function (DUF4440)